MNTADYNNLTMEQLDSAIMYQITDGYDLELLDLLIAARNELIARLGLPPIE